MALLGPHLIAPSPQALAWAHQAPIIKCVDDATSLHLVAPGCVKIYRKYFPTQEINRPGSAIVQEVLAGLGNAPCDLIELFNEVAPTRASGLDRHLALTQEAVTYLALVRPDLQIVGYSFATGNPELADWQYLRSHNFGGVRYVGMHCYWAVRPGASPGPEPFFSPWNALRFRSLWQRGDPQLVISECGYDQVRDGPGNSLVGTPGFRSQGVTDRGLAVALVRYAQMVSDPAVVGITPFTLGGGDRWQEFDYENAVPEILRLVRGGSPMPVPAPTPSYTYGPGVAAKLQEEHDTAVSNETYLGSDLSITFGHKGLYIYSKQANRTYFLPAS